jgi:hypothetical protein
MVIRFRFNLLLYAAALLVALKVTEVIDWSWGWVLAPLWLPAAVVLGIGVIGFFFAARFLAKLKQSFGLPATPGREEVVINDGDESVTPDSPPHRRIGNTYDHE